MIQLSAQLYYQLVEYCKLQLPNEACGAFMGCFAQDIMLIQDFIPIKNVATNPSNHFEFDRKSLLHLLYPTQKSAWIGIFHSHPRTAAYPSDEDLSSLWKVPIYVIISFSQANQPIMKSYEILQNQQKKPYSLCEQTFEIIMDLP